MKVLTANALLASFAARLPAPTESATLSSVNASADQNETVDSIQAMAVRGFSQVTGKLVYVKAKEHFLAAGEPVYAGDYVQLTEGDANRQVAFGRAELATDEEVAAAQKAGKAK